MLLKDLWARTFFLGTDVDETVSLRIFSSKKEILLRRDTREGVREREGEFIIVGHQRRRGESKPEPNGSNPS